MGCLSRKLYTNPSRLYCAVILTSITSDVTGEAFEGARDRDASAEETETGKQMRASCM
jgi:hypothetical protein